MLWVLLFSVVVVSAGNQEMIENRVQELDNEHKRVLELIPDKPKDGEIIVKSYIRNDKNEWVEYQVIDSNDRQKSKRGKIVLEGRKTP